MQGTATLKKTLVFPSIDGVLAEKLQLYLTRHFSFETGVSFSTKKG